MTSIMTTPIFQVQAPSLVLKVNTPSVFKFLTKDATGAAVDVSSGYSVGALTIYPASNRSKNADPVDITGACSVSFSATSADIGVTQAQSVSLRNLMPVVACKGLLYISNDGGTTQALLGEFSLNIDQDAN